MHRAAQAHSRARAAVGCGYHLAAGVGDRGRPVVVVVAVAARARQAVNRHRLATEAAVAVVDEAAADVVVRLALHAALRVVDVGTIEVGICHRSRTALVGALDAALHTPEVVVVEAAGLVAGVGLPRQLAERVVGVAPVARVGVAHARLASQKVVADAARALPAALASVAAVDLRQTVGGVVGERDLGLDRPFVAAGQVAAQEGGAAELVLLLPAGHAPRVVALTGGDDRGGEAVVMVAGSAAVGRALTGHRRRLERIFRYYGAVPTIIESVAILPQ